MKRSTIATASIILTGLAGCATAIRPPDIGELYSRAARSHDEHRNPVIVIPGILGSRLEQAGTGRIVWGAFAHDYANPQTPDGARLVGLPMRAGAALRDLTDDVVATAVLDRVHVHLFGLPLELNAYINILATLGVGGYRDQQLAEAGAVDYGKDHFTCFQFAYDWRRDNVENARRLHEFILQRKAYVERELDGRYGPADRDVRFDLVAHSMGGLIARYYLRYGDADLPADGSPPPLTWAGAQHVERAFLVGTPNAGSIHALLELVNGAEIGPTLPVYPPAVVGTMPSVYQLLPRGRHGVLRITQNGADRHEDPLDPALWRKMQWGLASPEQGKVVARLLPDVSSPEERTRLALDHQAKCLRRAAQFHAALDVPATPPTGTSIYLFAGDAVKTASVAAADPSSGGIKVVESGPGDGTVLRASALMDERLGRGWQPQLRSPIDWHQVSFLFADHLGMTRDLIFTDNLLFLLLEEDRSGRPPA